MPPTIQNAADCKIHVVIRFLSAKGVKAADIHRRISEVYGKNIKSDGMVRKWVKGCKDARKNVNDDEPSERLLLISNDLVQQK